MLNSIAELAKNFEDVEAVKKELKRIQSVKCRLKKMKHMPDYTEKMKDIVAEEQALKEVRDYMAPKRVTFTTMTEEQIKELNYEETIRAIKSVQSKKCNSQYLTDNIETNVEYQEAVKLERMLLAHKETVKPVEDTVVKKSAIVDLIEHVENLDPKVDKDYIVDLLKGLLA